MRLTAWLGLLGFAGTIVAAGACSSNPPAGDKYPAVGDFCKARAQAECQVANYCEIDQTTCQTARTQDCLTEANQAAAQGRTYTPGKAPACVDAANSAYSSNPIKDPTTLTSLADTCARVFAGSVDKNGACSSDYQCSGDRVCDKQHCGDKTVVKNASDGCANIGEVCDTGLYCSGTPAVCVPKMQANQQCSATAPCLESLQCLGGTCQARVAIGSPCTSDDNCTSGFCDVFNPTGAKCGSEIVFAPGGLACNAFSQAGVGAPDAGGTPAVDSSAPSADAASE